MPARNFTNSEERQIAKIYLAGHSTRKIAKAYGLNHHISIVSALNRQNIDQRKPADRNRLYQLNKYTFDAINNELVAYWWGFLYADGTVYKRSLKLSLSIKDKEQVVKLKKFLSCEHPIKITTEKLNGKLYQKANIFVTSQHLTNRLRELGIQKNRPNFNQAIQHLPNHLINHWIRGYFDGDGGAKNNPSISFVGSKEVLTWIREQLFIYSGTNPNLSIQQVKNKNIRRLVISGRIQALKVTNFIYQDAAIWMERKRNIVNNWPKPKPQKRNKKGQFI